MAFKSLYLSYLKHPELKAHNDAEGCEWLSNLCILAI